MRGRAAEFGDDAALYAGGTELVLVLKLGLSSVQHLIERGVFAPRLGQRPALQRDARS